MLNRPRSPPSIGGTVSIRLNDPLHPQSMPRRNASNTGQSMVLTVIGIRRPIGNGGRSGDCAAPISPPFWQCESLDPCLRAVDSLNSSMNTELEIRPWVLTRLQSTDVQCWIRSGSGGRSWQLTCRYRVASSCNPSSQQRGTRRDHSSSHWQSGQ